MWKTSLDTFVGLIALITIGALIVLSPILLVLIGLLFPLFMPVLMAVFIGLMLWEGIKQAARSALRLVYPAQAASGSAEASRCAVIQP
jgi:hypothetical protein